MHTADPLKVYMLVRLLRPVGDAPTGTVLPLPVGVALQLIHRRLAVRLMAEKAVEQPAEVR